MKTNDRNITKNINGYKVELFERRPATRVAYPAYCGECIDEEYGQEYDVVAGGKFLGRARREILVKFARGGRKYGKPTWVFYDEFMGDAVDASMDKSLTACLKRQIRNDEWYGHIGDLVKYGLRVVRRVELDSDALTERLDERGVLDVASRPVER